MVYDWMFFYETETKTISYIVHKNAKVILYKKSIYKYICRKYNEINENDYILKKKGEMRDL